MAEATEYLERVAHSPWWVWVSGILALVFAALFLKGLAPASDKIATEPAATSPTPLHSATTSGSASPIFQNTGPAIYIAGPADKQEGEVPALLAMLFVGKNQNKNTEVIVRVSAPPGTPKLENIRWAVSSGAYKDVSPYRDVPTELLSPATLSLPMISDLKFDRKKNANVTVELYYQKTEVGKIHDYIATHLFKLREKDVEEETCDPYSSKYVEGKPPAALVQMEKDILTQFAKPTGIVPFKMLADDVPFFKITGHGKTFSYLPQERKVTFEYVATTGKLIHLELPLDREKPAGERHSIIIRWVRDDAILTVDGKDADSRN